MQGNGRRHRAGTHVCLPGLWISPETHPTSATISTSSVSALGSSARLPWSVACTSRSVAPREPHAQGLTSRTHRARAYPMLLCFAFSMRWTRRAHACGADTSAGRSDGHKRVSLTVLIRFATSMKHDSILGEPRQAHASHKAARIGSSYVCDGFFVVLFYGAGRFES